MVTSNHHSFNRRPKGRRDGALLGGVCSSLAARLGWNVWALRVIFLLGLAIQTIATGLVYLILSFLLHRFDSGSRQKPVLKAEELGERSQRIADLERRFRDMEGGGSD